MIRSRNDIGFHVSAKLIKRGLSDVRTQRFEKHILIIGDDHTKNGTALPLGLDLLIRGTRLDISGFERILQTTATDATRFSELVQLVFLDVLVVRGLLPFRRPRGTGTV